MKILRVYAVELENLIPKLVMRKAIEVDNDILAAPSDIELIVNTAFNLNNLAEEHIYLLCTNVKCRAIASFLLSKGGSSCSVMDVKDLFSKALLCGASGFAIAHNHPSGDVTPSETDFDISRRVKKGAELLGLEFLDHVIVGKGIVGDARFSFMEHERSLYQRVLLRSRAN